MCLLVAEGFVLVSHRPKLFQAHNTEVVLHMCDKEFLGWFEGNEEFSHEETSLLLRNSSRDQLPAEIVGKLERLELLDDLEILPRNLKTLFKVDRPAH